MHNLTKKYNRKYYYRFVGIKIKLKFDLLRLNLAHLLLKASCKVQPKVLNAYVKLTIDKKYELEHHDHYCPWCNEELLLGGKCPNQKCRGIH